ncbi:MAG: hypothetical protein WBZ05_05955 [Desulfobacterales bacterium]
MGRLTDDMTRLCGEIGDLRSSREGFISDLRHGISELKAGAKKMQSGFRSEHEEMSRNMKDNLGTFVSDLKSKVSDMQSGFCSEHEEMSRNMKDNLGTFVSDLKGKVSDMQSGFRKTHTKMAEKTKGERERFLSELGQSLNVLRQEIAGFRREFAVDIAGARRAWFGHFPAGTVAAESEKIKTPHAAEAATEDEVIPDDLTDIAGIGPARQGQLNKAGYYTFAQLAKSTPEKLRKILKGSARSANVENWIKDAMDLAQ